ncbi:MAG: element excision factor XisH family protein [Caldilineaceae bacterium]
MSAKDIYHEVVKQALTDDGWNITADPLRIDLGGERVIAADRQGEKIAVEIKSFLRSSAITDFHEALGQYRVVIHIDIKDNKVWLQQNLTDQLVAEDLVARGIPKEHIVLGFQPVYMRKHTEFAVN